MGNSPNLLKHLMLLKSEKLSPQKQDSDFEKQHQVQSDRQSELVADPESFDEDLAEEG